MVTIHQRLAVVHQLKAVNTALEGLRIGGKWRDS
jgi:hypothetical protein